MYSKKSSSQYLFSGTETKAFNREIMINNAMILTVSFWIIVLVHNLFELINEKTLQQVSGLYLIGFFFLFSFFTILLIGVISIRPNDLLRRVLVERVWDKLFD